MTIYIVYFILILIVPDITSSVYKNRQKAQKSALKILMVLMYLLLALKAESVGCDTVGYKETYDHIKTLPFNDFSYSHMESGFLLMMKVFNYLGFSFQLFTAVLYAIVIIPLYYLIKKYSSDVLISVMILFCLDFFVFACSGLRQVVAMSFCVMSFLLLKRKENKLGFICSVLVVVAASFIHRSAFLFIPVLLILFFKNKIVTYISFFVAVSTFLFLDNFLLNINAQYELSNYRYDDRLTLGLMFVFDVIMFVFFQISIHISRSSNRVRVLSWQIGNILLYGLVLMIGFNGSMMLRSAAYELQYLSILMPMALSCWPNGTRRVIRFVFIAVLFYCLYFLILVPSTLLIVPYKFFFQN